MNGQQVAAGGRYTHACYIPRYVSVSRRRTILFYDVILLLGIIPTIKNTTTKSKASGWLVFFTTTIIFQIKNYYLRRIIKKKLYSMKVYWVKVVQCVTVVTVA